MLFGTSSTIGSAAVLALSLLSTAPSALVDAAECAEYDNAMKFFIATSESVIWSLRQRVCGDDACGNTQTCTVYGSSHYGSVSLYRKDAQYNFPNCWDATADIITQCDRNWWKQGWWQLGDEFYQINVSPNDGFKRDVDDDGVAAEWTFTIDAQNITSSE